MSSTPNTHVIDGMVWVHGHQVARFVLCARLRLRQLRASHGHEAHHARAIFGRDGEGGSVESAD